MRNHLKKLLLAVMCISAVLLLSSCAKSDAAKYTDAQKLLTQGKYSEAVEAFSEIENYEDSSKYIMYVKAVQLAEGGQHELAISSLKSLKDFKDSELLVVYYNARRYEANQEYEEAAEIYESIATFKDSAARSAALPDLILQREFAEAEMYLANENTYSAVYLLEDLSDQQYSDSETRMLQDMYDLAEKALQEAKTVAAAQVFGILAARNYRDSAIRMQDSLYAYAIEEMEKGEYEQAASILGNLGRIENYAPAEDTLKECLYRWAIQNASSGDYSSAYSRFIGLQDYKDSAAKANEYDENYAAAVKLMSEGKYDDAYAAFTALKNYADSAERAKESIYLKAKKLLAEGHFDDAISLFSSLNDYSDSANQVKEIQYLQANALLTQGDYDHASQAFALLGEFSDSAEMVQESIYQKGLSLLANKQYDQAAEVFASLGAYSDSATMVKESAYQKGKALAEAESYAEAYTILIQVKDYKDTASLIAGNPGLSSAAAAAAAAELDRKFTVGNVVVFGRYEQDDNQGNGKEPVQWRVLKREGQKALLISEMNLDSQPYNKEWTSATWETCTLRTWLNGPFLNAAFTRTQQGAILTTAVKNEDNPSYGTDGGRDTSDQVFLLSIAEAETLFRSDEDRVGKNTAYAKAQGAYDNHGAGRWWLRSPGDDQHDAAYVYSDGSVIRNGGGGLVHNGRLAVRPALWLDLASGIVTSEAP